MGSKLSKKSSKDPKIENNYKSNNNPHNKYASKNNQNLDGSINIKSNNEEIKDNKDTKSIGDIKDNENSKNNKDIEKKNIEALKKQESNIKNKFSYEFIRNIATDSLSYGLDDSMVVFKSIDNILYFIYPNRIYSIISYNLIDNKKINEIKNAHNKYITNIKHYLYEEKNQDLIISISLNNILKLWNINNWECLLNLENVNYNGDLLSACFLILNKQIYILTSNCYGSEPIKVFNLNGIKIKEINSQKIKYIDIYYDKKSSKPYILTGKRGLVESYDYNDNNIYHIYNDNHNDDKTHYSLRIKNDNNLIKLIESSEDGKIRIWNFHTGELLNKIYISDANLFGICLWKDDYLLIGCGEKTIKILDIEKSKIIGNMIGHNNVVLALTLVNIPNYGECLISQENGEFIKLWKIKLNI